MGLEIPVFEAFESQIQFLYLLQNYSYYHLHLRWLIVVWDFVKLTHLVEFMCIEFAVFSY